MKSVFLPLSLLTILASDDFSGMKILHIGQSPGVGSWFPSSAQEKLSTTPRSFSGPSLRHSLLALTQNLGKPSKQSGSSAHRGLRFPEGFPPYSLSADRTICLFPSILLLGSTVKCLSHFSLSYHSPIQGSRDQLDLVVKQGWLDPNHIDHRDRPSYYTSAVE